MSSNNAQPSARAKRTRTIVVILTTVLLGLVSVSTAFCGYQASIWNGKSASYSGQANANRSQSFLSTITGNQMTVIDVDLFSQWVDAYIAGDTEQAEFYRSRFRKEARPAFEAWLALDPVHNPEAPPNPFVMPEYVLQDHVEAARLEKESVTISEKSSLARQKSQNFSMTTILLASASLFAGIASRSTQLSIGIALAAMSLLSYAWALSRIIILLFSPG